MPRHVVLVALLCLTLSPSTQALNSKGWYNSWETFINLFRPPAANRPVSAAEQQGDYPLLTNPPGFDDGFRPGLYGIWQEVRLAPETGALCGNGTPFKFYIRRAADNLNVNINLEPGGACWDYASCSGQAGIRGARNPNGIPDNYINKLDIALLTPFITPIHWVNHIEQQRWNTVFIPYCTGDIHAGNRTVVYEDPTGQNPPLTWHHNGLNNVRAVIAWLRQNLPQPRQMLDTGCSAGGTGALVNHHFFRSRLAPHWGYLLSDSGPVFEASGDQDPSWRLHQTIRQVWGLDPMLATFRSEVPGLDPDNLGSIYRALSQAWPGDRLGVVQFQQDAIYSAYSYERFFDDIVNAPDEATRKARILARWHADNARLKALLDDPALSNWAYYIPNYRNLNDSHCATIVEFENSDVQEDAVQPGLQDFVERLTNPDRPLRSSWEQDQAVDYNKPFNPFYALLNALL